jgi:hypothetical protein
MEENITISKDDIIKLKVCLQVLRPSGSRVTRSHNRKNIPGDVVQKSGMGRDPTGRLGTTLADMAGGFTPSLGYTHSPLGGVNRKRTSRHPCVL